MKTKRERLLSAMSEAAHAGAGIHITQDLAVMVDERRIRFTSMTEHETTTIGQ